MSDMTKAELVRLVYELRREMRAFRIERESARIGLVARLRRAITAAVKAFGEAW